MADSGENRMNLAALQRVDPYINGIVETAGQVALYKFNGKLNEWEKTEIEGTLFVYSRCATPVHGFMIMNRLNRENLIEPLSNDMEFQRQDPFLLYRNTKLVIYGIWFYNRDDCNKINHVMNRLTESLTSNKISTIRQRHFSESHSQNARNVDILSMLTKAQNEYNQQKVSDSGPKRTEPKTMTDNAVNLAELIRPKAVRAISSIGPPPDVTNGTSGSNTSSDSTSLSVAALFANAEKLQQPFNYDSVIKQADHRQSLLNGMMVTEKKPSPSSAREGDQNLISVLHRIINNPEHSLEHIERKQRGGDKLEEKVSVDENLMKKFHPNHSKGHLKEKPAKHLVKDQIPVLELDCNTEKLLPPFSNEPNDGQVFAPTVTDSLVKLSPPVTSQRILGLNSSPTLLDSGIGIMSTTPPKTMLGTDIQLMSPMMFTSPKVSSDLLDFSDALAKKLGEIVRPVCASSPKITPLTRDQLIQALEYLLKNDQEFTTKIHSAYVKSLQEHTTTNIKS